MAGYAGSEGRGGHRYSNIFINDKAQLGDIYKTYYGRGPPDPKQLAKVLRQKPQHIDPLKHTEHWKRIKPDDHIKLLGHAECNIHFELAERVKKDFPKLEEISFNIKPPKERRGLIFEKALVRTAFHRLFTSSEELFIELCEANQIGKVRQNLQKKHHPDHGRGCCGSALQTAIVMGNTELFLLLLEFGADVNLKNDAEARSRGTLQETPLLTAIMLNKMDFVKLLIQRGANVNLQSGAVDTPLKAAVLLKRHEVVKELVAGGAVIQDKGGVYGDSLQAAAYINCGQCLKMFCKAELYATFDTAGISAALEIAISKRNRDAIRILLQNLKSNQVASGDIVHAAKAAAYFGVMGVFDFFISKGPEFWSKKDLRTLVKLAAQQGNLDVARLLVEYGTDVFSSSHREALL